MCEKDNCESAMNNLTRKLNIKLSMIGKSTTTKATSLFKMFLLKNKGCKNYCKLNSF